MKKLSFTAGVAAIALAVASIFPAAGVFANTVATTDYEGNPIVLRRTINNVSGNVTNTFGYTVSNTAVPSGGSVSGAPTSASIVFSNAAPTSGSVTQTQNLGFSSANYSKVGDYEFTITETSSSDSANYPVDSTHSYTAVVQVRYPVDGNNVPDNSKFIATITVWNGDTKVTEATWTSASTYTYIQATEKTTGNMADASLCFAYTIDIPNSGVTAGGTYAIDINPTSGACSGSATSVAAGAPATVYLKNGDTVRVGYNSGAYQLPVGAQYTITKTNHSDDYIEKFDGSSATDTTKTTVAIGDDDFDTDNKTALENNLDEGLLTGIVTNFWFYIMLLVAGLIGFFIVSRRKQDDEEQQQA